LNDHIKIDKEQVETFLSKTKEQLADFNNKIKEKIQKIDEYLDDWLNICAKQFLNLISDLRRLTAYHKDFIAEPEEEFKGNEREDFDWLFIQNDD